MSSARVVGLGAGGHGRVVLELVAASSEYEIVGLLDPRIDLHGTIVGGVPVIGDDDLLARQYHDGVSHFFIGLGGTGDTQPRQRLYERALAAGLEPVTVVHPSASVSSSAQLGRGATILAGAVVSANARLGDDVVVNSGAIVEHDCAVGDHVHVASGCTIASGVAVGVGAHVGAGATVVQRRTIGARAIVGAGAVVIDDIEPMTVVIGVPARVLRVIEN